MFLNLQISSKMFLSQQLKRNMIIVNKNGKYELTDELLNDIKFKIISKSMEL